MKLISVVTPCYNEAENIRNLHARIRDAFARLPGYGYEHICIDNASSDGTIAILRELARDDKNLKVILNARDFGFVRSPHHALLQARGDAVIGMASDLQDPPELIPDLVRKWEEGYKIVLGVKASSEEPFLLFKIRELYYDLLDRISEVALVKNAPGFGLYDRAIIDILRGIGDPYPYFRGLLCDIGFERAHIEYRQKRRGWGASKVTFYVLYDMAMCGVTSHSKVPLRLAAMLGLAMSMLGFLAAGAWLALKLAFWDRVSLGATPLLIGLFLLGSVQLFFIGVLGEYVGAILTQVRKRPLVFEKERINF
jgi:glycosyltransferase involved in cell wall biosynthesis